MSLVPFVDGLLLFLAVRKIDCDVGRCVVVFPQEGVGTQEGSGPCGEAAHITRAILTRDATTSFLCEQLGFLGPW